MSSKVKVTEDIYQKCILKLIRMLWCMALQVGQMRSKVEGQSHD